MGPGHSVASFGGGHAAPLRQCLACQCVRSYVFVPQACMHCNGVCLDQHGHRATLRPPPCSPLEAARDLALVAALLESASKGGEKVPVAQL